MDTNVLVSALRSRKGASFEVYRMLRFGRWRCLVSNHLLLEYEEQLVRQASELCLNVNEIEDVLNLVCDRGEKWTLRYDWLPVLPRDADDEPLVQLAHESAANLIITHNIRDLQPASVMGITVLRPKEFLGKVSQSL